MKIRALVSLSFLLLPMFLAAQVTVPVGKLTAGTAYRVRWVSDTTKYLTLGANGVIVIAPKNNSANQLWLFTPSGQTGCFYVRSLVSKKFVQSCNMAAARTSLMRVGNVPVVYYISENVKAGSPAKGAYRLTSTDCANYLNNASSPRGFAGESGTNKVTAWTAGDGNTLSFWTFVTADDMEKPFPLTLSARRGAPGALYHILSPSGATLKKDNASALSWSNVPLPQADRWYFLSAASGSGYQVVNARSGQTLASPLTGDTLWRVASNGGHYTLTPSAAGTGTAAFALDGDSILDIRPAHGDVARSLCLYMQPCGVPGERYLTRATLDGDGAVKDLKYPLPEKKGNFLIVPSAEKPSYWHTISYADRAIVRRGAVIDLSFSLSAAPSKDERAYVYFDWDRDGLFEDAYPLATKRNMSLQVTVPATASLEGATRFRFRLDGSGNAGADDDVRGQIVDFQLEATANDAGPFLFEAKPDDPERGRVEIAETDGGASRQVTAVAEGTSSFLCWREGKTIVSLDTVFSLPLTRDIRLTASFTPNTQTITGITLPKSAAENRLLVTLHGGEGWLEAQSAEPLVRLLLFSPDGTLMRQSGGKRINVIGLSPGAYIVKAVTRRAAKSVKVTLH